MKTSEHQIITPRRNFLIRALGFTAAGATVPVGILTLADAKARIEHHKAELMRAWSDYYAGARCTVQGGALDPDMVREERGAYACLVFCARMPHTGGGA
ncbi:hypothetical protein [Bradyrhizobium neotropicale]|uniref:hypothetical protein n=1 Tax=Bradyrhizobium neotropicale TaxID=1497615 RepID=UPI001AD69100|nr:hypothetical protein [Bradyrhizobium neotropicale]MBO4226650.1 hypothetical protein [Bradyrhizobium neotropicale]